MNLQESIRKVLKEIRVPRNERVELYRDNNIIVVVPLTHRALKKYAHKCLWCINSDDGEWEEYHKGLHAIIIQRNPKKPKIGITGQPVPSEIFLLAKWDNNESSFEDVCEMLEYEFRNDRTMADYYVTISNDINNFGTNIVYYSPENGVYDQEDNFLWNFNYKISDIPNVTPEVIKIMDEYLTKEEFERPDAPKINQQELDEYARTLKNARQQGVGLRFPKSAIKSNPSRFRPYNRKGVNESDLETNQNDRRIVCEKCGWSWDLSDGGDDPYTCHKCGNENHKEMDLQESIRRILREETRFSKMGEERYKSCYMSDITRMEIIDNFLKEVKTNSKYNEGEPNYDMLLDDWDGYDDQVYIQNQLDKGRIIFYEGWVDSCWSAVYKKPQYKGMDEEEVIDNIITKRFPRIAEEFNMTIDDYGYFNNGDGYIMYIVFKKI